MPFDIYVNFKPNQTKNKFNSFVSSALDSGLLKKAKDILNNHAFGTEAVKGVSQDYNKPLFIPAFSDSIQAIVGQSAGDSGRVSLDMWKHQYTTHFPQSVRVHTMHSIYIRYVGRFWLLFSLCTFESFLDGLDRNWGHGAVVVAVPKWSINRRQKQKWFWEDYFRSHALLHELKGLKAQKNTFLALFWAYIGQPDSHIGSATLMLFASIYPTNPRSNL